MTISNRRRAEFCIYDFKTNRVKFDWRVLPYALVSAQMRMNAFLTTKKWIKGKCIDIGCGTKPLKDFLTSRTDMYIGVEYDKQTNLDICGDGRYLPIKRNCFDTALLRAVLEHTPEPIQVVKEANRVLKTGGYLIVEVPFLYRFHGNDYYRYTHMGIESILTKNGFEVVEILPIGGFFTTSIITYSCALFSIIQPLDNLMKRLFRKMWPEYLFCYVFVVVPQKFFLLMRKPCLKCGFKILSIVNQKVLKKTILQEPIYHKDNKQDIKREHYQKYENPVLPDKVYTWAFLAVAKKK